jgi:hypothetical protein
VSEQVACTLSHADLRSQRERWIALGERYGITRRATTDGLRLTFRDDPAAASELEALVEAENACCRWAAWSVERDAEGALVMAARAHGEGVAALHGMFTHAGPWSTQ